MRKYTETTKLFFKSQIAYRFDTMISIAFTISKIALAYVLWGAIFADQTTVAGFTFHTMITYYIISSFISQLDQSPGAARRLTVEIRDGLFSKYLVRPIRIFGYFAAHTAGVALYLLSFNLLAACAWVILFRIEFALTTDPLLLASALCFILLGLLFMMQLNYYIGILAFKFQETGAFMMIKENIIEFATGSLIPLTIMPPLVLQIMQFLPFYYTAYLPSMLLLGRNQAEIGSGLLILVAWNLLFAALNALTYRRLRIKYEGVGI